MKVLSILTLTIIVLSGCASNYHRKGLIFSDGGHSEIKLGENVFQVVYEGNDKTNSEQVSDLNLLRSAEVALKHGFGYFIILQISGRAVNQIFDEAPAMSSTASGFEKTYSATSTILCSKEKPEISHGQVYDAASVAKSIRKKYGL